MTGGSAERLLADVQSLDEIRISRRVFGFEVIEQPAAFADEHQETAAGVVILRMRLEMLCQVVDAFTENGYLHFRGTGVRFVSFVAADELCLAILGQRHRVPPRTRQSLSVTGCAV